MNKVFLILSAMMLYHLPFSQVWTEDDVIQSALAHHPSLRIADLEIQKHKSLERTAFNPEQPQFAIETPTDVGLGFEVEQEFDWPGVYTTRSKWLKSQTKLAEASSQISRLELIRDVRLAFLEAQIAAATLQHLSTQDSIWKEIANKSQRLYDAGEINLADLVYTQKQSALMAIAYLNTQLQRENSLADLKKYIGQEVDQFSPPMLLVPQHFPEQLFVYKNYGDKLIEVEKQQLDVARAERYPGFMIGYLRAPEPDTEFRYRFKAGITVPIWQSQYKGEAEAARIDIEQKEMETELIRLDAMNEYIKWNAVLHQSRHLLDIFEIHVIPQRAKLYDTYHRLYDAGEIDYESALRNIADSFSGTMEYLETMKMHNQAVIYLDFFGNTDIRNE